MKRIGQASSLTLVALSLLAGCGGGSGNTGQAQTLVVAPAPAPTPAAAVTPTMTPAIAQIDVLLVIGQSNATGFQLDRSIDYAPSAAVLAWNGTSLVPYEPNVVTGIEWSYPSGSWAAELAYVRRYRVANPDRTLVVLRYTAPSTQLHESGDTATVDWSVNSRDEWFDGAGREVQAAFGAIRTRLGQPIIRMVWWQQGENDIGPALAPFYQGNLTAFIAGLRNPAGAFAVPSTAPIAIGRVSNTFASLNVPTVALVRAAQRAVADANVGGPQVLLNDDDLVLDDKIHLSKASQITMGERLWAIDRNEYIEP